MTKNQSEAPCILYKYKRIDEHAESLLSEGEIYFATTEQLNDPMEKFFRYKKGGTYILVESDLLGLQPSKCKLQKNGTYLVELDKTNATKYMLSKIKNNEDYGILSLCERRDSIVMYTHYADAFRGICIGFDWAKFDLNFAGSHPPVKNFPRQVSYSHTPPEIDGRPEEWLKVFITKSEEFSWEKEWRMFYSKGKLRGDCIRQAIREIVFGHNTPKEVIRQVVAWIGDLKNVDLFITEPVIGRFELAIVPYKD